MQRPIWTNRESAKKGESAKLGFGREGQTDRACVSYPLLSRFRSFRAFAIVSERRAGAFKLIAANTSRNFVRHGAKNWPPPFLWGETAAASELLAGSCGIRYRPTCLLSFS